MPKSLRGKNVLSLSGVKIARRVSHVVGREGGEKSLLLRGTIVNRTDYCQ